MNVRVGVSWQCFICKLLQMLFLASWFFSRWWWRRYVPPKHRFLQEPHGVTSHNTVFFTCQYCYGFVVSRTCNRRIRCGKLLLVLASTVIVDLESAASRLWGSWNAFIKYIKYQLYHLGYHAVYQNINRSTVLTAYWFLDWRFLLSPEDVNDLIHRNLR
jgi:hypothetical protein